MPNIIDLIAQDSSASDISNNIKDTLYAKATDKIEALRRGVSDSVFAEPENEVETEVEQEPTEDSEE